MDVYEVIAKRWEHGWELHIEGVGVTQSRGVADAEEMVRHYLELEGVSGAFAVRIDFRAEDDLEAEIRDAHRAAEEAARAQELAAEKSLCSISRASHDCVQSPLKLGPVE